MGNHRGLRVRLIPAWPPAPPTRRFGAYLSFLPPQLLQLIPSPTEPQGHKLTPADQAWAPPDPRGPVGAKGPPPTLPPTPRAAPQLPTVAPAAAGVPPKPTPGVDAFAKGERVLGASGGCWGTTRRLPACAGLTEESGEQSWCQG